MQNIGVIGLGNMGFGIAKNLMAKGFNVYGYDLVDNNMQKLRDCGGKTAASIGAVAKQTDVAFVMVVNDKQANEVIFSPGGLADSMASGSVIVITATIGKAAVEIIESRLAEKNIHLIDSPVSGGRKGAESGELTLMVSCQRNLFDSCADIFKAIAKDINYVGEKCGDGQVVKACLQGLVGCIYSGIFEALMLGAKNGVRAETLYSVIGSSVANTPLFQGSVPAIMKREFSGTGSNIGNTYKDLTLTLNLAENSGVPMMTTSIAKQFFQAGITKFPNEDNQCLIKLLEDVVGVKVEAEKK